MHATMVSWLIVKWVGISIAAAYLVLLVIVLLRFRRELSRLRGWLILPAVLGVFISEGVPLVFEDVMITRICFIAAGFIYIGGIATLLRGLAQRNHKSLLKAEG